MVKKSLASKKKVIKKRNLKIIPPPLSKKSPKYAYHPPPPNAGHGFAALPFFIMLKDKKPYVLFAPYNLQLSKK